jgi:translation initiation factor 5
MTKFFGYTSGSQNNYDKKTEKAVVNGILDITKVHEMISDFVNKFILCEKCKLPETSIQLEENTVFMKCQACGHISKADPTNKLTTYILKNPPSTKSKNEAMVEKKQSDTLSDANNLTNLQETYEWSTDLSEEAVKKRREEEGLSDRIKTLTLTQDFEEEEIIISPGSFF